MGLDDFFHGKRVLVTGGAGTVGTEMIRQISRKSPKELRVIDHNEEGVFRTDHLFADFPAVNVMVGDVRDTNTVHDVMDGIDIVFHAAALKHVSICERSPLDAVMTNIKGVENIIRAALHHKVPRVVFTSTDKAVNPTNVMGTSKLMGERIITAANNYAKDMNVVFISTRFGNVMGSRGSVISTFFKQIRKGGPVTVTDKRMTRFIMSIEESVRLVLAAAKVAKGGEVFVTKMPTVRVIDLARVLIDMLAARYSHDSKNIEIVEIGVKPGEKLYEELMTSEEANRTIELEHLYAILPAFRPLYKDIDFTYSGYNNLKVESSVDSRSQSILSYDEIREFIEKNLNFNMMENENE
ncbi:MAG: polysaccharide biosynthesis protein [Magnetococcales bacterium]|nr:polysaccharide biosynthesis protein [Magnetococcales bacterium]MBF0148969.1 polysaccharide biosynthesis protein [Magnetococcales bacterium]MBF0603035.1 polysaccharide biosynthesis protein [Magnetococcales bacterium]